MAYLSFTGFVFNLLLFSSVLLVSSDSSESFILCLSKNINFTSSNNILYSQSNSLYSDILDFSIQNLMFMSPTTPKPQFIITPLDESQIQAAVICSRLHGLLVRVRSGGHDYEGLSYISYKPFIIIDLVHFQQIDVNIEDETAWVQAGATVGQVYYRIAQQSSNYGFPAGICHTTGVGGYISGGGIGFLMRKYGLAADNVLDAHFIDVNGKILDRKSMGEDLFWAIRGGGGASFGVIVSWKIRLVHVPSIVTVFNVQKTLEQGASNLFYKWQNVAHKLPKDLVIRTVVQPVGGVSNRTVQVLFQSLFLGTINELLHLMETSFPELGVEPKHCAEMSWISSILNIEALNEQDVDVLLNRSQQSKKYFKGKSDFVKEAISISDLESIWEVMLKEEISPMMICEPFGGRMDEISEYALPFPHRVGNLYNIQYFIEWLDEEHSSSKEYVESARRLYNYMTPYVSKSPRASYLNYKDLDLGTNVDTGTSYLKASVWGKKSFIEWLDEEHSSSKEYVESTRRLYNYMSPYVSKSLRASYLNYKDLDLGTNVDTVTSYLEASIWGKKYFKNNFERLVYVKSKVDPGNFFWNEQSIPPLILSGKKVKDTFLWTAVKKKNLLKQCL